MTTARWSTAPHLLHLQWSIKAQNLPTGSASPGCQSQHHLHLQIHEPQHQCKVTIKSFTATCAAASKCVSSGSCPRAVPPRCWLALTRMHWNGSERREPAALVPSWETMKATFICYFSGHPAWLFFILVVSLFQLMHFHLLLCSFPWNVIPNSSSPTFLSCPKCLSPQLTPIRDPLMALLAQQTHLPPSGGTEAHSSHWHYICYIPHTMHHHPNPSIWNHREVLKRS